MYQFQQVDFTNLYENLYENLNVKKVTYYIYINNRLTCQNVKSLPRFPAHFYIHYLFFGTSFHVHASLHVNV